MIDSQINAEFFRLLPKTLRRLKETFGINESDSFLDFFNALKESEKVEFKEILEHYYNFDPDMFFTEVGKLEGNLPSSPSPELDISPGLPNIPGNDLPLAWDYPTFGWYYPYILMKSNVYSPSKDFTCLPCQKPKLLSSEILSSPSAEDLPAEVADAATSGFHCNSFLLSAAKITVFAGLAVLSIYAGYSILAQPKVASMVTESSTNIPISETIPDSIYSYGDVFVKLLEHICSSF